MFYTMVLNFLAFVTDCSHSRVCCPLYFPPFVQAEVTLSPLSSASLSSKAPTWLQQRSPVLCLGVARRRALPDPSVFAIMCGMCHALRPCCAVRFIVRVYPIV